jgi:hypothetical protein
VLYFPVSGSGQSGVAMAPLAGGSPTVVTMVPNQPSNFYGFVSIAADDQYVYWAVSLGTSAPYPIQRLPASGTGNVQTIATGHPGEVMLDDACLYWTDSGGLMTMRKPP